MGGWVPSRGGGVPSSRAAKQDFGHFFNFFPNTFWPKIDPNKRSPEPPSPLGGGVPLGSWVWVGGGERPSPQSLKKKSFSERNASTARPQITAYAGPTCSGRICVWLPDERRVPCLEHKFCKVWFTSGGWMDGRVQEDPLGRYFHPFFSPFPPVFLVFLSKEAQYSVIVGNRCIWGCTINEQQGIFGVAAGNRRLCGTELCSSLCFWGGCTFCTEAVSGPLGVHQASF